MRVPILLLLPALSLASCVVSYKVSPHDPAQHELSSPSSARIFYHIKPVADKERESATEHFARDLLGVINLANPLVWLEYPSDPRAYLLTNPWNVLQQTHESHPEKGLAVVIDGEYFPAKRLDACASAILSGLTLGIIPYYCDETGLKVRYDLYVDRQLKKTYTYEIRKKGMVGLLLLPLAWVNLFTDDLADAIERTARQFLRDAARDGYLLPG